MAYQQINRAQLRTMLQDRLGNAGATFWRVSELDAIIQEVLRSWNALTGFWKNKIRISGNAGTIANQVWYTIPGTLTSGMRIDFNGTPLDYSSLHDLDYGQENWESQTTATGGNVPTTPQMWAPAGLNLIAIWPADAAGGNSLYADGVIQTPILAVDGDFINIGREELNSILDEMQHIATFKEGGKEAEASMELHKAFLNGAASRNAILMGSAPFRRWMGIERTPEKRVANERAGAR